MKSKQYKKFIKGAITIFPIALAMDTHRMKRIEHENKFSNQSLYNSINNLAKANRDLANTNTNQQEKIDSLILKTKELQNQNDDLANQHSLLCKQSTNEKSKILEAISQNTEEKGKIAETIFKETKELRNEFTHNNILGFLENYVDAYKEFLSTLALEQLICLSNILMLWMIFSTINGLIITYYGNILINWLQLELKFPKLAKIIILRSKLSQKLIKLEIVYLYVLVLIAICINIYLFF